MRPDILLRNYFTTIRMFNRNKKGSKFEPEAPYMAYMCKPGATCLHFGASDGRHSYLLAGHIGEKGIIHAYEPSKYSFAIMSRLIKWHGLKNVFPHNAAIGDSEGTITLNVPRKASGHLGRAYAVIGDDARGSDITLALQEDTDFERQETDMISLDGIMRKEELDHVDFIRCDIEGAEVGMIHGGKNTIERDLPAVLIEIHPFSIENNFNTDPNFVHEYFLGLGYRMWRLDDDDKELIEVKELDAKRRWRDYFLLHPSKADGLPDGPFKAAMTA